MASKKKINKKINLDNEEKIINKFNLNLESDDSSDSDDEKLKKQSNRFKFMDSDSDEDDKPIIKIQNDKNKIDLSTELIGKNKPKEKINKKKREEIKKDKNKVDSINNKNLSNHIGLKTIFSSQVEILVNGVKLIEESNITINEQCKYVVIGTNGVGKTTLVKYLYEQIKNQDVLMIDQDIQIESSSQKIREFILDANIELHHKYLKMKQLEQNDNITDEEMEEYQQLADDVYTQDWDKFEAESNKILYGLGITNLDQPVSLLSGGWRMRLALGKALLRCPTVLILDEPTNHLDLNAVIWLTDYLLNYKKTLIVITHQVHLMNTLGETTWYIGNPELTGTKVYTIRGNYYNVTKVIDNYNNICNKNWDKFSKRVEELRKKSTPKKEVDLFIKSSGICRPPKVYEVNIDFEPVQQLSTKNIIEMKDVIFGYSNDNIIFNSIEFSISMGSKNIIVGPNGVGKTTLFKLALQKIEPISGTIIRDNKLRIGHYNQQIIDNLPLEFTPIEFLQSIDSRLDNGKCRGILGKLGIKKTETVDLPNTKIFLLSGGQKARVSLASVQMQEPHLILLDEPTNHLDLESIEGLIKGINNFNGGIILITHDMYLIESIISADIYELSNKKIIKFRGSFDEYCDKIISN